MHFQHFLMALSGFRKCWLLLCVCICLCFSECLGEDITYENTEPVANVSDGVTVNLKCMTGYIGFYKLKCKKGQWLTFIAQRCSSKKIVNMTTSFFCNLIKTCT